VNSELWARRVAALGQFRVAEPSAPTLSRDDDHHLRTVLRARSGEEIVVTNGRGDWSICEVGEATLHRVTPVEHDASTPETVLYLAPLKGDRSEWAVAKATELGVSRIVPLVSARLVVKFRGEVRDKIVARWRRIAAEACGQCRRTYDVVVEEPVSVGDVDVNVAVADFSGEGDWRGVRRVAIGPEGGWHADEWPPDQRRVSLGPTVLRAETAAVVAASLVSFAAGGWGFTLGERSMGNDESST
jgi:16S rRNA (uracil1498-N3)-methyltransferase